MCIFNYYYIDYKKYFILYINNLNFFIDFINELNEDYLIILNKYGGL